MNTFTKLTAIAALMGATALATPAISASHTGDNPMVGGAAMMADMTIVENASNSPIHTTLVAAVKQAGLVETLSGDGPFTVFAPTDEAFARLDPATVAALMEPRNQAMLQKILTCHVVAANAMSDAIAGMIADDAGTHPVPTVGGCTLQARMQGGSITLTDERGRTATVTTADVRQSNGVIHVIDTILLPADTVAAAPAMADSDMADSGSMADGQMADGAMAGDNPTVGGAEMFANRTIVENALNSPVHTTLVASVQAADLVDTLNSAGPFTVFAPTDEAFAALPAGTVDSLVMPENKDQLTRILTAHVVPGRLTAADIASGIGSDGFYNMTTVSGDALSAKLVNGSVYVFDEHGEAYKVSTADVMQSNGVIQVVDGVLLPR